ncbi:fatty acid-binding protein, heart [Lingula anatina]|uniref:Fatty acid-binding protein, heart n=1 Tax=Lingula anatina TaxID=7574 RepID=A0A1S3HMV0_LINAN|nr:fatty acid-binding protein, heart [Lingula anatina]|eukprot:XP_013386384.1 fatty acid-binding protein, heart [Lingula anatina]
MAGLEGKWKLIDSKNFEEYMKAVGVGAVMRKLGATAKPSQEISRDGDKFTIKTKSAVKNTEITFTLGQEFEETTADGRKVKSVVTLDGDKLVHSQKGDIDSTITREIIDGNMVMYVSAKDVTCTRTYARE